MSCFAVDIYGNVQVEGGKRMDTKKIGEFLKILRKEKGLTQEQLAEILLVSGRTVSRWETGTNMPDLSIIIQGRILCCRREMKFWTEKGKAENSDKELKETLSKMADDNKLKKEKVTKAANAAVGLTFAVCAAMIFIQSLIAGELDIIAGEAVVLFIGGAV